VALLGEIDVLRLYATYGIKWVTSIHHEDNACMDFISFDPRGELVPKRIPWRQCDIGFGRGCIFYEKYAHCRRYFGGLGHVEDMDGTAI
jgi:hypothetical protein